MEDKDQTAALSVRNELLLGSTLPELPPALARRLDQFPENRRRPVNKTLYKNADFQLTYNGRAHSLVINAPDLIYSAIPYDTGRKYIQRAAVQYLLHPEAVTDYIQLHRPNLERYLQLSLFQTTGQRLTPDSPAVKRAYQDILDHPLFKMQVAGRLLQHDETGPLSANLAGKFLYSENQRTGITAYLTAYLEFIMQLTTELPLVTDGQTVTLLTTPATAFLTAHTDVTDALTTLPPALQQRVAGLQRSVQPLRRSEVGSKLAQNRKNYVAHSVAPSKLEQYFTNVLPTDNDNQINVISDVHVQGNQLPFSNPNFNVLAGDASDNQMTDKRIKGIYVIGNHDLLNVLPTTDNQRGPEWQPWRPFMQETWFQMLINDPDAAWHRLPVGDDPFYAVVADELAKRFPNMLILNNTSIVHDGVRYVGVTVPIVLARRKRELQAMLLRTLSRILPTDTKIPTVIVSHAPLFNELSLLAPTSRAYRKTYVCDETGIVDLFKQTNVVGVIHGHHHIPASAGQVKMVNFADKSRFVVCSIYSKMNTGFDLKRVLETQLSGQTYPPVNK